MARKRKPRVKLTTMEENISSFMRCFEPTTIQERAQAALERRNPPHLLYAEFDEEFERDRDLMYADDLH